MRRRVKLLALVLPYLVFVVASAVLGAAFVVPTFTFDTLGETGLIVAIVVTVVSLVIVFMTEEGIVTTGRKLIRDR